MKKIILAVILALPVAAFATGNSNSNNSDNITNNYNTNTTNAPVANATGGSVTDNSKTYNTNTNLNTNVNTQGQQQGQAQGQLQGQVQGQGQAQSADNKGNSQSMTYNEAAPIRQAPGLGVGAATTTAVCMVGVSGGISAPVGAIALGTATRDAICSLLEVGKTMILTGYTTGNKSMIVQGEDFIKEAGLRLMDEIGTRKMETKSATTVPGESPFSN